ncbi:MAG TPA: beta-agarase [Frateuria sp.]|uniref:beta-agarase n=1 Tax=Frateuria sp. TaxID=2211372 RepID=UPI002D7FEC37|nr:beta-agarase [Frateuria sp.]HET6805928.1 beta-agarase [Frateuria sp.]
MKSHAAFVGLLLSLACRAQAAAGPAGLQADLSHVRAGGMQQVAGETLRRYTFEPSARPYVRLAPERPWRGGGQWRVRVQNAMPWAVTLSIDLEGVAGAHLQATVGLPAGPPQTLVVPLHATAPRAFGMQAGPPMPVQLDGQRIVLATTVEGAPALQAVRAARLSIPAPQAAQVLLVGTPGVVAGDTLHQAYAGIVDRYGQYTRAQWPEKIDSDAALRAVHAREHAQLAGTGVHEEKSGHANARATATGWFHTQKLDGRWRLMTPEGHPFFSLGINTVTADGGRSYVQGREWMFAGLPPAVGAWQAFYGRGDSRRDTGATTGLAYDHGRWFDFYAANLFRVDGTGWRAAWRTRTRARLAAWGFNTLGNWSDTAVARGHRLAYTRPIAIAGTYADVATGYDWWGRMPDPFDPRFAAAAERAVAAATRGVRDDPWLLGYFADNELAWASPGPQGRWALALGTLRGEPRSPAKQAFLAMLKRKYGDALRLGVAWGIGVTRWEALEPAGFQAPVPDEAHPAIAADYSAWLRAYAGRYFRTVAQALRRHDPHHLFLGGRFAVRTPEAVAACAQWCDVISINVYADLPQHGMDLAALRRLDRPVLISEFAFGSTDRGPFGAGPVPVWNEAQRGEAYARFLAAAAADPSIVGAHWFQYADEPVAGRLLDGENAHLGLVGITDIPFGGFVRAVAAANAAARETP